MAWSTDAEHRLVSMSHGFAERVGQPKEDLLGRTLWDSLGASDGTPWEHMRRREPFADASCVFVGRCDGFSCICSGYPQFGTGGVFMGYTGVISGRMSALSQASQRLEARLLAFATASSDWLWETNAQHQYVYTFENFERLTTGKAAMFLGRTPWDPVLALGHASVDGDTIAENAQCWERMRAHEPFRQLLGSTFTVDGKRYVSRSGTPYYDEDGAFLGFRGASTDVTAQHMERLAREQLESSLRDSEQKFRDFSEISSDFLTEMDAQLRITYFSGTYTEHTGYQPEDFYGRTPWGNPVTQIPEVQDANAEAWSAMRAHEPFRRLMGKVVHADGTLLDVARSGQPRFDSDGAFLGYRYVTKVISQPTFPK